MSQRIEDYAVLGDCQTAALVGKNGSVDWLCWPRFDSDACFSALLGGEENGRWRIAPADGERFADGWTTTRRYRGDTLILETTYQLDGCEVRITDFMPVGSRHTHIVRLVEGVRGSTPMLLEMTLRFGYGRIVPWVSHMEDGLRCIAGPDLVLLRTPVKLHGVDQQTVATFTVEPGDKVPFVLSYGDSAEHAPPPVDAERALIRAEQSWSRWAARGTQAGRYTPWVKRSLLTLKALTFRRTGGVTAAATTSLPEALGGPRNWDYRYCWLRDSTFTLLALMNGGFYKEAEEWRKWLGRAVAGSPEQLQIMYAIDGERHLLEWELPWLAGYENSQPVRVGNAAAEQLQLDIYGEVLDAIFHSVSSGRKEAEIDHFPLVHALIEHLRTIWRKPDQGIWEARSGAQPYTYSKMMCWVAFDRAVQLAEMSELPAPLEDWRRARDEVHAEVCAKGYNEKVGAFTQYFGSDELDSSLLLMPLVGFLPISDERVRSTIVCVEQKLMRNGLLMRYDTECSPDGLPPGEGTFLACSFWLVSCLKMLGREDDARKLFEHLLTLCNDVGLLAEEYDTSADRQVGNFPQAFSHIALVNAAFDLEPPDHHVRKRHHRHRTAKPVPDGSSQHVVKDLDPHTAADNQSQEGK